MTFLDKLLLGKNIPSHTDTSNFPSSTYRIRKCLKKHCSDACFAKKDFDWEFWAFFLSEKEVQRSHVMKKIKTLSPDLRLSVWYKLLGARNVSSKINQQFDVVKSDRKLVDFILELCRSRSVSDVITSENLEKDIFLVYRNLFDIFYKQSNDGLDKQSFKTSEFVPIHNGSTASNKSKAVNFRARSESQETFEQLKNEISATKTLENNERESSEALDLFSVKPLKRENDRISEALVTTNQIYTNDFVDEELILLIDYMFKKDHSKVTNVFRLLYVFFVRLGFDDIFLMTVTKSSNITRTLDLQYYKLLQETTDFRFIKTFLRYTIEKDSKLLDTILDLSLCFSSSSFCEILGFCIKHCEDKITGIINKEVIKRNETIKNTAEQENQAAAQEKDAVSSNNLDKNKNFKDELLEAHEKITRKTKSSVFENQNMSNKPVSKQTPNQTNSTKQNSDNNCINNLPKEILDRINCDIAKVLYNFLKEDTTEKLDQMRKNLKPQKIDALEIDNGESSRNEDYFDFLIVQNESVKAQTGLKSDLVKRLEILNTENENLLLQNHNLKENLATLETGLKEFNDKYLIELKKMLEEANKKNQVLEKEVENLKVTIEKQKPMPNNSK